MIKPLIKTYSKLNEDSRYIRTTVFVLEQGFEEEFDTIDDNAIHFVMYLDNKPIATARIYVDNSIIHLGRFAVLKEYRALGYGKLLINHIEEYVVKKFNNPCIELSAQKRAIGFYSKCGYVAQGEYYLDEGYPHIKMIKFLR